MKNLKLITLLFFTLLFLNNNAQNTVQKNVLPPAEKPQSGSLKDLNALEKEKIQQIDIKKSNSTVIKNQNTNPDEFSTQPIVKGKATVVKKVEKVEKSNLPTTIKTATTKDSVKLKETVKSPTTKTDKPVKVQSAAEIMNEVNSKSKKVEDDFSSTPIVKGKAVVKSTTKEKEIEKATSTEIKKYNKIDTTKKLKDFYFETTPITNSSNKPSYNLPNPKKEDKEIAEAKIPVNSKTTAKENLTKEDLAQKESYDKYAKEADSIRKTNKRWLDSVLASLPVKVPVTVNSNDYIEIYVSGGGLYAGQNAKIYDRLSIFHTGMVQREYKTKLQGEQREEKKISKDELMKLAQYIVDLGFFEFKKEYDCDANDVDCNARMKREPQPIPLNITVAIGARRNKVSVALFAPNMEANFVDYPPKLEKILNAIYSVIEK